MSNPGVTKLQVLVLTGNPTVDSIIRYGLVALCAGISGSILGWLNSHGFHDPNLVIYVPTAVGTVLGGLALSLWGIIRTSKNEAIVRLREAVAVQAGINVAESTAPTPKAIDVATAQQVIADHATPISNVEVK